MTGAAAGMRNAPACATWRVCSCRRGSCCWQAESLCLQLSGLCCSLLCKAPVVQCTTRGLLPRAGPSCTSAAAPTSCVPALPFPAATFWMTTARVQSTLREITSEQCACSQPQPLAARWVVFAEARLQAAGWAMALFGCRCSGAQHPCNDRGAALDSRRAQQQPGHTPPAPCFPCRACRYEILTKRLPAAAKA